MEVDAFTADVGHDQGRVVSADGSVRFVLGSLAGHTHDLGVGDYVEVTQSLDVTGTAIVRAGLRVRASERLPAGLAWEASVVVDGAKHGRVICVAGRTRDINDLAANVSKLAGTHSVGVRLELVKEG